MSFSCDGQVFTSFTGRLLPRDPVLFSICADVVLPRVSEAAYHEEARCPPAGDVSGAENDFWFTGVAQIDA